MAQPAEVLAFRKRLQKRGYSRVELVCRDPIKQIYFVVGYEPLAGQRIQTEMDLEQMKESLR